MKFFDQLAVNFDLPILDWIAEHLHCAFLNQLMPLITFLGNGGILWIILAVVCMIIPKYRKAGISMAIALVAGLVVCNMSLKPAFARIRPFDYQLQNFGKDIPLLIAAPHDYSFPSGHTIASFEASVALLMYHRKQGLAALVLAILIAFSRLYLYVHYPSDVIASILLGTILALSGYGMVEFVSRNLTDSKTA